MQGPRQASALLLRAPETGAALPALDSDVAFTSPREGRAFELLDDQLVARPLEMLPPTHRNPDEATWLPFWRVRFTPSLKSELTEPAKNVLEKFQTHSAFVRAFALGNASYVGHPGLRLTFAQPAPSAWPEGKPAYCLGARLPSKEAALLGRLFILEVADRDLDISGVRIQTVPQEVALVLVPFFDDGKMLTMLQADAPTFSRSLVQDLESMRAERGRLE